MKQWKSLSGQELIDFCNEHGYVANIIDGSIKHLEIGGVQITGAWDSLKIQIPDYVEKEKFVVKTKEITVNKTFESDYDAKTWADENLKGDYEVIPEKVRELKLNKKTISTQYEIPF